MNPKRSRIKRIRDGILLQFARSLLFAGSYLPAWGVSVLGSFVGKMSYGFSSRQRNKALRNVKIAFPELTEEQQTEIVRGSFVNMGKVLFEIPKIRRLKKEAVEQNIEFNGLDIVTDAIDSGRSIIIATGHIGNWELMGAAAAKLGIPVDVIARELSDPKMNELVLRLRKSAGVNSILRESPSSAKEILRSLKQGRMLALLIDQDIKAEGTFCDFFGRKAFTPIGAAALAVRTGAVFAAAAIRRISSKRHRILVKEIKIDSDIQRERAIIEATQRATLQLQEWIRQQPDQWVWIHDRWRTRPEGDQS